MTDQSLVTTTTQGARAISAWTPDQWDTLRRTIAVDLDNDEFLLFGEVCKRTGLDPFAKQIYAIARGRGPNRKLTFQTGIDGYRLIAERSGLYNGRVGPEWYDAEAEAWIDVWIKTYPPAAARVGVYKKGVEHPIYATVMWNEYAQYESGGTLNSMWAKMGANQLAKCAEGQALRAAFPNDMSGVYTSEEMGQASNPGPRTAARGPQPRNVPTPDFLKAWAKRLAEAIAPARLLDLEGVLRGPVTLSALSDWRQTMLDAGVPEEDLFLEMRLELGRLASVAEMEGPIEAELVEQFRRESPTSPPEIQDVGLPAAPKATGKSETRVQIQAVLDEASHELSRPVTVAHALTALGLGKADSVAKAWESLEPWYRDAGPTVNADLLSALFIHFREAE